MLCSAYVVIQTIAVQRRQRNDRDIIALTLPGNEFRPGDTYAGILFAVMVLATQYVTDS